MITSKDQLLIGAQGLLQGEANNVKVSPAVSEDSLWKMTFQLDTAISKKDNTITNNVKTGFRD